MAARLRAAAGVSASGFRWGLRYSHTISPDLVGRGVSQRFGVLGDRFPGAIRDAVAQQVEERPAPKLTSVGRQLHHEVSRDGNRCAPEGSLHDVGGQGEDAPIFARADVVVHGQRPLPRGPLPRPPIDGDRTAHTAIWEENALRSAPQPSPREFFPSSALQRLPPAAGAAPQKTTPGRSGASRLRDGSSGRAGPSRRGRRAGAPRPGPLRQDKRQFEAQTATS
jgi:hypothetical protein